MTVWTAKRKRACVRRADGTFKKWRGGRTKAQLKKKENTFQGVLPFTSAKNTNGSTEGSPGSALSCAKRKRVDLITAARSGMSGRRTAGESQDLRNRAGHGSDGSVENREKGDKKTLRIDEDGRTPPGPMYGSGVKGTLIERDHDDENLEMD